MTTTDTITLLTKPKTPNYTPDRIGFGAGTLTSLGGGIYEGVQFYISRSGVNWWTVGALITTFSISVFGLVRTQQHNNFVYEPLTDIRVDTQNVEAPNYVALTEAVGRIYQSLKLSGAQPFSIQGTLKENLEARLLREFNAIVQHYSQKLSEHEKTSQALLEAKQNVENLQATIREKEVEIQQLKIPPSKGPVESMSRQTQTKMERLERDLKEAEDDLKFKTEEVARLTELLNLDESSEEFFQTEIAKLRTLLNVSTPSSPQSNLQNQAEEIFKKIESRSGSRSTSTLTSPVRQEQKKDD